VELQIIDLLVGIVNLVTRLALLFVVAQVFMSYFLSPFHPLRKSVERISEPFLAPIRRIVPPVGMIDFSPLILIVLIQLAGSVLIWFLHALR
jgi:YggT family protein